jgi:pimeloyl-ACP methyl ester carboxylesterase
MSFVDRIEARWMARRRRDEDLVDAGGARFRVRVSGTGGPTIVIAPDPPNVIEHLDALVRALAARHRVVCVEMPGFGFSSAPPGFDFSTRSTADSLGALLDVLGLAPYAIALPCVAGLAGATLAASRPDIVSHFIGVQSPGLVGAKAWARRVDPGLLRLRGVGQAVVLATRRRLARAWFDVALADEEHRAAFVAGVNDAYDRGATYPLASALQAIAREQSAPRPPQPSLLVWGGRDRTHKRTEKTELCPDARLVVLERASHFPDLEDPTGFAREVSAFLTNELPGDTLQR